MKKRGKGVVQISSLFEKYKNKLQAPQSTVINNFIELIEIELGYQIQKHQCRYSPQSKILSISVSGPVKTEILLQKELLLQQLQERVGEKSAPKQII